MGKKADMSINTIVVAALALMVLIILLFIFRNQITNIASGFTSVGNNAKSGVSGKQCQTLLGGRQCAYTFDKRTDKSNYEKVTLPTPSCTAEETKTYEAAKDKTKAVPCDVWTDCYDKISSKYSDCYEITKKETETTETKK